MDFFGRAKNIIMGMFTRIHINKHYPLVICYIAIEHGPFIVDFPLENMVDLSIVFCTFTRPGNKEDF